MASEVKFDLGCQRTFGKKKITFDRRADGKFLYCDIYIGSEVIRVKVFIFASKIKFDLGGQN